MIFFRWGAGRGRGRIETVAYNRLQREKGVKNKRICGIKDNNKQKSLQ